MYKHVLTVLASVLMLVVTTSPLRADVALMMAEEAGCIYCARWNAQIAPIYPKTGEGAAAPLRRVDILQPLPEDITLARRVTFTPTFVLLVDGKEVSRIEGYPGEDFFWGLLGMMLQREKIDFEVKTLEN